VVASIDVLGDDILLQIFKEYLDIPCMMYVLDVFDTKSTAKSVLELSVQYSQVLLFEKVFERVEFL
jgi:hypothetical protein